MHSTTYFWGLGEDNGFIGLGSGGAMIGSIEHWSSFGISRPVFSKTTILSYKLIVIQTFTKTKNIYTCVRKHAVQTLEPVISKSICWMLF